MIPRPKAASIDVAAGRPATQATAVYEQIRADMLRGRFAAGAPLRIDPLMNRYGVGRSPIREALNRLASEDLLTQEDQRGFRVPPLSLDELEELTRTRCWLYDVGIRESISRSTSEWEEGVLIAYHRISRFDPETTSDAEIMEHARKHRRFHAIIIERCNSRWITDLAAKLFDLTDRYRAIAVTIPSSRRRNDEHRDIMQAVLDGRADDAVAVVQTHIRRTVDIVRASGLVT